MCGVEGDIGTHYDCYNCSELRADYLGLDLLVRQLFQTH